MEHVKIRLDQLGDLIGRSQVRKGDLALNAVKSIRFSSDPLTSDFAKFLISDDNSNSGIDELYSKAFPINLLSIMVSLIKPDERNFAISEDILINSNGQMKLEVSRIQAFYGLPDI